MISFKKKCRFETKCTIKIFMVGVGEVLDGVGDNNEISERFLKGFCEV